MHSSAFSLCSLISLQYCKDNNVLLCFALHFSLNTSNSPAFVLHFLALHHLMFPQIVVPLFQAR